MNSKVTDRSQTTLEERFRLLYKITSQTTLSTSRQLQKALKLTCELLGLDIGIISRIKGKNYIVEHFYPKDSGLKKSQVFPLGDTYCSITLGADEAISISHMEKSPYRRHPCYNIFELESYIGVPIEIDGGLYGTLNFSSSEPFSDGFTEADLDFVRLLGEWVSNIVKQKKVEQQLQKSRELYRLISENAADMVCLHKPDGTYEYVSPSVKRILGYKPKELIGKNPYDFFHPDDLKLIKQQSHNRAKAGERVKSMQYRMQKKNGEYIWFETSTEPIIDDKGTVIKLRTGSRDISERKKLELLLQETNKLASVGGWEYDLQSGNLTWTDEVYNIHEIPVGREINVEEGINHYPPEARPVLQSAMEKAIERGEVWDLELPFITAKNNSRWVRAIGKPHKNTKGEVHKLSGVFQDLTERKKIEQQLVERNSELERLNYTTSKIYSVIGHDLRSPINAITGFTELLLNDFKDDETYQGVKKKLEIVYHSAHKVSRLLNDLLNWARIQTGDLNLLVEEFHIDKIVQENIDLLSISARKKGVELSYSPTGDKLVKGDERMITTITRNLLSNAIKYSNAGDNVTVKLGAGANFWSLAVEDEGVGMKEEARSKLFSGKTNQSTKGTANEKGTGLGLILCKELAEMHGGTIDVDSELGKGSTFTLRIPHEIDTSNDATIMQTDQPAD